MTMARFDEPTPAVPAGQPKLLLIGAGHAPLFVLEALARAPLRGVEVTVVAPEVLSPYSGMLPGFTAGHYDLAACHVDARRLARAAGARFVESAVTAIDPEARIARTAGGDALAWDVASLDVGSAPAPLPAPHDDPDVMFVKPIARFATSFMALLQRLDARRCAGPRIGVIGGGAAGFEMALAIGHRLSRPGDATTRATGGDPTVTLVTDGPLLAAFPPRVQRLGRRALARRGITLVSGDGAIALARPETTGPLVVRLASGRTLAFDAAVLTTPSAPAAWLAASGLPKGPRGFVATEPTLEVVGCRHLFAAGDCADVLAHPRPKAGVFAVRQGPPLAANLRRALAGEPLQPFEPQAAALAILSLGERRAIATRGTFALEGHLAWVLKDRIDRAFIARFERACATAEDGSADRNA